MLIAMCFTCVFMCVYIYKSVKPYNCEKHKYKWKYKYKCKHKHKRKHKYEQIYN